MWLSAELRNYVDDILNANEVCGFRLGVYRCNTVK